MKAEHRDKLLVLDSLRKLFLSNSKKQMNAQNKTRFPTPTVTLAAAYLNTTKVLGIVLRLHLLVVSSSPLQRQEHLRQWSHRDVITVLFGSEISAPHFEY